MSRHISVASAIEKNRISSEHAYVVLLEVDVVDQETAAVTETIFLARNPEDVLYRGETYVASSFDFQLRHSANQLPEVTVRAVDYTQAIQSRMEQYSGGVGFRVRVLIVNTGATDAAPEMEERFFVVAAKVNNYVVEWVLGARNPLRIRFPRRHQRRDRCPWAFRGDECGYDGEATTCDYTLNGPDGCAVKENTLRYGGFPGLRPYNVR